MIPFFNAERLNFFRPLYGRRREIVVVSLLALYDRIYGSGADYRSSLNQENLRALFAAAIQASGARLLAPATEESVSNESEAESDPYRLASEVIRTLRDDGWIDTYYDGARLSHAFRFTRHGKIQTEALLRMQRPGSQSRHRNLRACRNHLQAFISDAHLDAYELVDARDCALQVISDLSESIDFVYEQARSLVTRASETSAWDEFTAFMQLFERNIRPQLTTEHVDRYRIEIRQLVEQCRALADERVLAVEAMLNTMIPDAQESRTGASTYHWILECIGEAVEGACNAKQPELVRAVHQYTRHVTTLLREVMAVRLLDPGASIEKLIEALGDLPEEAQEYALDRLGWQLSVSNVRLIDPASIAIRQGAVRRTVSTNIKRYQPDEEGRLKAQVKKALAGAFSIPQRQIIDTLVECAKRGPVRLSQLPIDDAREALLVIHAPEYARMSAGRRRLHITRLKSRIRNQYFAGPDFLIRLRAEHER